MDAPPSTPSAGTEAKDKPTKLCWWGKACKLHKDGRCNFRHETSEADESQRKGKGKGKNGGARGNEGQGGREASLKVLSASVKTFGKTGYQGDEPGKNEIKPNDVLVDSGANEVARPYNSSWFREIENGFKGEMVTVNLAGVHSARSAMTQYGEIMLPGSSEAKDGDSKWIVPVCRLVRKLGCVITWGKRGMRLDFPSGVRIRTKERSGLCFVAWEDFNQ